MSPHQGLTCNCSICMWDWFLFRTDTAPNLSTVKPKPQAPETQISSVQTTGNWLWQVDGFSSYMPETWPRKLCHIPRSLGGWGLRCRHGHGYSEELSSQRQAACGRSIRNNLRALFDAELLTVLSSAAHGQISEAAEKNSGKRHPIHSLFGPQSMFQPTANLS